MNGHVLMAFGIICACVGQVVMEDGRTVGDKILIDAPYSPYVANNDCDLDVTDNDDIDWSIYYISLCCIYVVPMLFNLETVG